MVHSTLNLFYISPCVLRIELSRIAYQWHTSLANPRINGIVVPVTNLDEHLDQPFRYTKKARANSLVSASGRPYSTMSLRLRYKTPYSITSSLKLSLERCS